MAKKNIDPNESKDARFRRVSEPRILKMLYAVNRVTKMATQSNYVVYDTDAQKILDIAVPVLNEFLNTYTAIAENKAIKGENVIEKVF